MRASQILAGLKRGRPGAILYRRLRGGFLRLKFDVAGDLDEVSWSRRRRRSEGLILTLDLCNQTATCKTPHALAGLMWVEGGVSLGSVFEGSGGKRRRIAIGDFIDECVEKMIEGPDAPRAATREPGPSTGCLRSRDG